MPNDQICPSASASWERPSSSRAQSATLASRSPSGSVARAKEVSTLPAPTCSHTRAPSCDEALRSAATKSTGAVAWRTQTSRSSPACGLPVMPLTTAMLAGRISSAETSFSMVAATPPMSGEWNACDTSSGVTCTPSAASFAEASRTPALVPEITVCNGWFRLATTTPSTPRTAASAVARSAAALAMAPGSGNPSAVMARPRCATSRTQASGEMTPAAAAAAKSPRLCPSATSPCTPSLSSSACRARPTAAIAGWQTSVAVRRRSASGEGCA